MVKAARVLSFAAAGWLALSAPAFAQNHSFKMATGWPGGPLMDIGAKAFAERIDFLSGGRIKVQVFPGGGLGNALKVPETVKNGVAEMGHTWMGYDWGAQVTTTLFGGYAGSFDTERMLHWIYEGGGAELQRQFRDETAGVVSMPLFIRTAEVFLHSRKPVRTLADLQGLKIRTAGAWLDMTKTLGAAPVTTAGGEIYPALERGVIDATEWGTLWENISPGLLQGGEVPDHPRRASADGAVRAGHQQGCVGQAQRPRQEAGRDRRQARDVRILDAHRPGGRQVA